MKINRKIKNLTIIALGVMLLNIFVGAYTNKLPEKILVNTEKSKIAQVKYGRYDINAKRIYAENENIILYLRGSCRKFASKIYKFSGKSLWKNTNLGFKI